MKKTQYLKIILFTFLLFLLPAMPIYADMPNPDSDPTIEQIDVFHNLLETGDMLYLWEANTPYAVIPDYNMAESFIWQLIDTDGITVLGSTTGYGFQDDGYGYNVFSLYFSADDVASKGMVWETAYMLRLSGSPAVFATPRIYNFPVAAGDYTTLTDSDDNQSALADEIILLATDLNTRWGLSSDYYLTAETETGVVLSAYGENVFRGAIYGCQGLAPDAFQFIVRDISVEDRTWSSNYTDSLADQYNSYGWIATARNAARDFMGTDYDLTSLIFLFFLCVGLVIGNLSVTGDHWNALIDVSFLLVIASRLDVLPLLYLALICSIAFVYMGTRVWRMIPT